MRRFYWGSNAPVCSCREFEIVGEAVGKLPQALKDTSPNVAWQDIKDFRNLLTHEYFGIDLEIVWGVIQTELPELIAAVELLRPSTQSDPA